ncbi:MAG: hypothetical protein K5886_04540 [Lachnospiraceae bacterium]|nr:hypothetical protein [Lachnospiraceae bacterium]
MEEEPENHDMKAPGEYFNEALQTFSRDFAYGGAIRHLVDKGYDAEMIIKEFKYPIPRASIEKMVNDHLRNRPAQDDTVLPKNH